MFRSVFCFLFTSLQFLLPAMAAQPADPSTLTGKIVCGYQGWFRIEGDGSGMGNFHYGPRDFGPGNCHFEMWPDDEPQSADDGGL